MMRILNLFLLQFLLVLSGFSQTIKIKEPVHFLALGDSYTIGQSVAINERWPNQFVTELTTRGFDVAELKIIAQTGWRTDNLQTALNSQMPLEGYNLVSLLIGVNNQFQGGSIQTYTEEFEDLLKQAIYLAGNDPRHVFVLSIPDYAFTPYGNGNPAISEAIDQFNAVNRFITENYNVTYINITPISRNGLSQPSLIASDGLHPSGLMYKLWVNEILKYIEKEVGLSENPALSNDFTISLAGRQLSINAASQTAFCSIYNIAGKELQQGKLSGFSETQLNLEALPGGIYFVVIKTENQYIFRSKIILI